MIDGEEIMDHEGRGIAYFSMEIGINTFMPTYSGGLGILAGDTIKSCADLKVPMVALTLLYKKGYFFQRVDGDGNQQEIPCEWNPADFLELLPKRVVVSIEGREVFIQAWQQRVIGVSGYEVPVLYLDSDLQENAECDRPLTHYLYGGDEKYRLSQEVILGIAGVRILKELGYKQINRYHMNEGHSALLTLELLNNTRRKDGSWDMDSVKRSCVFTTHTPVPAGMDKFSYDLVKQVIGDFIPPDLLRSYAGYDRLNMTLLALNLSHYENGVAKEHRRVSEQMFPGYDIDSITNGVHSQSWVCDNMKNLFDKYMSGWRSDSYSLRYALNIPSEEVWDAHVETKMELVNLMNELTNIGFDHKAFTIGFARRATEYKRPDLIFHDIERLKNISKNIGKIQLVFGGKAHPNDWKGKEIIKRIVFLSKELKDSVKIVYMHNYDIMRASLIVSGVDLWLNTPRKPLEASGTSGMKAAHNGVPSLSILDGWWIEGCIEDFTGWAIGSLETKESNDDVDADSLYSKLEQKIIPMYYNNRERWVSVMRHAIAINASFFNTHRMVQQYVMNAYM